MAFGAIVLAGANGFVVVGGTTSPVILITRVGLEGSFVVTVIDLFCFPFFPFVLNVALMVLDSPFLTTEPVVLTAVQPQLPFTFLISKSRFPVFLNTNS